MTLRDLLLELRCTQSGPIMHRIDNALRTESADRQARERALVVEAYRTGYAYALHKWTGDKAIPACMVPNPSEHYITTVTKEHLARRIAPWPDARGNLIYEGDIIEHPSGERGTVVFVPDEGDKWYVNYGAWPLSRLSLQVGNKGQAIAINQKEHPQ